VARITLLNQYWPNTRLKKLNLCGVKLLCDAMTARDDSQEDRQYE